MVDFLFDYHLFYWVVVKKDASEQNKHPVDTNTGVLCYSGEFVFSSIHNFKDYVVVSQRTDRKKY